MKGMNWLKSLQAISSPFARDHDVIADVAYSAAKLPWLAHHNNEKGGLYNE